MVQKKYILFLITWFYTQFFVNRIGGVMVSVLASREVDHGFNPRSGQTKDWLALNQDNVSEWDDMPIRRLLFQ
jgi:hypothetical protein